MRIRRLTAGDVDRLRRIRLDALRTDPDAFGSTLEREESRSHEDWVGWLSRCATFVAEDEGEPVGLVGGMVDDEDSRRAVLISMWVAPKSRGQGVGRRLVTAMVDWATASERRELSLLVIEGNAAAIALYEKCGFSLTGERVRRDRDGAIELRMSRRLA